MNEVNVLIEGYAREIKGGWVASSTVTLIRSGGKNIIVDPGCNRKMLIGALRKKGIETSDVDFVFLTHNHLDHTLLCGIFENAKVINFQEIYTGDMQVARSDKIPGTDIQIIETRGHSPEHCSLVVPAADGIYAVSGDVFWWDDNEKQIVDIKKEDAAHPEESDMKELINSRRKILELADYVVPGHGKLFKVKK